MDKLIEKLDEIFARYNVADEDIKAVGELIDGLNGDIIMEGEDFAEGEKKDGNEEAEHDTDGDDDMYR